jgi:hypothetical protein
MMQQGLGKLTLPFTNCPFLLPEDRWAEGGTRSPHDGWLHEPQYGKILEKCQETMQHSEALRKSCQPAGGQGFNSNKN